MTDSILLYYGWLADYGFAAFKPTRNELQVTDEDHRDICSRRRDRLFTDMEPGEDTIILGSLIVSFPKEFQGAAIPAQESIERAVSFEQAVAALKGLAHNLPCTESPKTLNLFHSTYLPFNVVLDQGLYSPRGYLEKFGRNPPKMYGQMSGDGICTTAEHQQEDEDSRGKKGCFPHGKHQYRITLEEPRVLKRGWLALSIIDWYIKLRHDFRLQVCNNDSIQSHDIASPICNRIQSLATFHKDLGYDVIENEFEHLIKRRHVDPKNIKRVGSFD